MFIAYAKCLQWYYKEKEVPESAVKLKDSCPDVLENTVKFSDIWVFLKLI